MAHFLTRKQQKMLMLVGNAQSKGLENIPLEKTLETLKKMNPDAFHNRISISLRNFYHEPKPHVVCKSFIISDVPRL